MGNLKNSGWVCVAIFTASLWAGLADGQETAASQTRLGNKGFGIQVSKPSPPEEVKKPDPNEAKAEDLRKSVGEGHAAAMIDLASMLEQGVLSSGVDLSGAYDLYEKAAARGDAVGLEKVCIAYLFGQGRPLNTEKAMNYCYSLPKTNAVALFSVGYDYDKGLTGPKDEKMALAFYADAAKKGSGDAMNMIGLKAELVDPRGARRWLSQSVVAGSTVGMDNLAALLESGKAGQADSEEIYWLYVNAARGGNAHSLKWAANLPPDANPLPVVTGWDTKGNTVLTKVVTDGFGSHPLVFNLEILSNTLTTYFPRKAAEYHTDGEAKIYCYIDSAFHFDTCLCASEYPLGYGFGPVLMALFNGDFDVKPEDMEGHPTARTIAALTIRWKIN